MAAFVRLVLPCALVACLALSAPARAGSLLPGSSGKEPTKIDANKLDYYEKELKMVYTGDVIAEQGASKVRCSVMTIFLEPEQEGAEQQMKRVEMTGPVTFLQKDKIGTGDNGIYDRTKNTWYLEGNVTLTQGPNVTYGDRLIYDLTTNRAHVESSGGKGGRVKSMFTPGSSKESGQKQN